MKFLSAFLSVCLISLLFFENASASQCTHLFSQGRKISPLKLNESREETIHAGDLLLNVFDSITKAPNNSRIKVFTPTLKYDGVSSLMILVSVAESFAQRGLKFDFFVNESISSSRHYDLLAERSTNTIRYRSEPVKLDAERTTTIVIESNDQTKVIRFDGELSSMDLKDQSRRRPIPVKYMGRNFLRASPFKEAVLAKTVVSEAERGNLNKSVQDMEKQYDRVHKSEIEMMTEADIMMVSSKAFDLALQLHMHKFGKSPSQDMNGLQILEQVLK